MAHFFLYLAHELPPRPRGNPETLPSSSSAAAMRLTISLSFAMPASCVSWFGATLICDVVEFEQPQHCAGVVSAGYCRLWKENEETPCASGGF
jgi:hypothetical protein